ncbi:MAG TPA: type II secretion system F family protein [Pirellulales bacterium]|nr:type II secretion system F family protein [Pirellulales bacterium]
MPASLLMGAAISVGAYAGRGWYQQSLEYLEHDFGDKLRILRRPAAGLRRWLIAWNVLTGAVFMVLVVFDKPVFATLAAGLVVAFPWYLLRRLAEARQRKIEDQLADAMVALSGAIKAGLSLAQSLEILATQCPKPISEEFRQIIGEYNLGKPLVQTLTEAKARLRSENFSLFAAAMLASHDSGGRLNETVDRIAHSVLELQRLERKILSETAQARKSAVYMGLMPLFVLIAYYFIDPENTTRLFETLPGQLMLSLAVVLNIAAYVWARKILTPDI